MLYSSFDMKDIGEADVILGIKIQKNSNEYILTQSHYIEKTLKKFGHYDDRPVVTPFDPKVQLKKNKGQSVSQLHYTQVLGSLMYIMNCTRPDLAYSVSRLSRYSHNPGRDHWDALVRVLQYLKHTMAYGLHYTKYPPVLEGYCDANWISNHNEGKSTSGYVFTLGGVVVSWKSSKQTMNTKSTMEAKFVALDKADEKTKWIRSFLDSIHLWPKHVTAVLEYYGIFLIGITYTRLMCGRIFENQMVKFSKILMNKDMFTTEMNTTLRSAISIRVLAAEEIRSKEDISKPDINKASSAGGKLHILKPSCERNGITPTPKENLSPKVETKKGGKMEENYKFNIAVQQCSWVPDSGIGGHWRSSDSGMYKFILILRALAVFRFRRALAVFRFRHAFTKNGIACIYLEGPLYHDFSLMDFFQESRHEGFCDANWTSIHNEGKSTSGYVFTLGGDVVSWKSSKQTMNTKSTMEAKFVALDKADEKAEWIRSFLDSIPSWPKPVTAVCIHCDSMAALTRAKNHIYNSKSRHIRRATIDKGLFKQLNIISINTLVHLSDQVMNVLKNGIVIDNNIVFYEVLDLSNDEERRKKSLTNDGSNSLHFGSPINDYTENKLGHSFGSSGSTREDEIVVN
ncbi:hypothetical protein Tco_0657679 [Tanacetum coccineum]